MPSLVLHNSPCRCCSIPATSQFKVWTSLHDSTVFFESYTYTDTYYIKIYYIYIFICIYIYVHIYIYMLYQLERHKCNESPNHSKTPLTQSQPWYWAPAPYKSHIVGLPWPKLGMAFHSPPQFWPPGDVKGCSCAEVIKGYLEVYLRNVRSCFWCGNKKPRKWRVKGAL